eukprot:jgi/Bigna1/129526/aug1.9_g4234
MRKRTPSHASGQSNSHGGSKRPRLQQIQLLLSSRVSKMNEWLDHEGARRENIEIRVTKNMGLGLFATRNIKAGEEIAAIPTRAIITEERVLESKTGKAFSAFIMASKALNSWGDRDRAMGCSPVMTSSEARFFAFLACERGNPHSSWRPYIDLIPDTFEVPLWWNADERRELHGTNLGNVVPIVERVLREVYVEGIFQRFYEKHGTEIGASDDVFSFENIRWAYCAYRSRAFPHVLLERRISHDDNAVHGGSNDTEEGTQGSKSSTISKKRQNKKRVGCMLPFLDIGNHRYGQKITWQVDGGFVKFLAGDDIEAGHEIYNNYGAKSNESLLMSYGFVVENNLQDEFKVKLGAGSDAIPTVQREHYLHGGGKEPPSSLIEAVETLVCGGNAEKARVKRTNDAVILAGRRVRALVAIEKSIQGRLHRLRAAEAKVWTANKKAATRKEEEEEEAEMTASSRFHSALIYRTGQMAATQIAILNSSLKANAALMSRAAAKTLASASSPSNDDKGCVGGSSKSSCLLDEWRKMFTSSGGVCTFVPVEGSDRVKVDARSIAVGGLVASVPVGLLLRYFKSKSDGRDDEKMNHTESETRVMYESLFPALLHAAPDIFDSQYCSWRNFNNIANMVDLLNVTTSLSEGPEVCLVPLPTMPPLVEEGGFVRQSIENCEPQQQQQSRQLYILRSICSVVEGQIAPSSTDLSS